jgi:DNA-binding transcriptional MerR regulator
MHYYKTGEFAKMANVSLRTIRYYDKKGLLKPSAKTEKVIVFIQMKIL